MFEVHEENWNGLGGHENVESRDETRLLADQALGANPCNRR
jgi:hypothetical protein